MNHTKETQQDVYYAELRLKRLTHDYLNACHTLKHFEHGSVGIAMAGKMKRLSQFISDNEI